MALTVPNTFVAGTTAVASEVNDNFAAVKTFVDGLETDVTALETKSPVITLAGDLTGSATLTNLGNATLTATIAANSVALGTDTTGNYVSNVTAGTGVTVTHTPGEGSSAAVAIDGTVVTLSGTQTLTNKTLTSPTITGVSPVVTLSGDVTGSATLTNLGSATITATIAPNSVALGTDTTGNYVSTITAGTGITGSASSESATPTIAIDAAVVPQLGVANTFTTNQIISGSTTADLLRITQTGTGNALVVEDSANPDSTPFVVDASGYVGIGTSTPYTPASYGALTVDGTGGSIYSGRVNGTEHFRIQSTATSTTLNAIANVPLLFNTNNIERMRIDSSGQVGIGATPVVGRTLLVGKAITGSTTSIGILNNGTIQSDVTADAIYYRASASTQAASFTASAVTMFDAVGITTPGAGSTVTTQFGFRVSSGLTGASTNNFGFYGDIASATGRWNLYMQGTAANYLAGRLGVGATLTSGSMAQITNTTAADKAFVVKGAASQSGNLLDFQNSAGTTLTAIDSAGRMYVDSSTAYTISGFGNPGFSVGSNGAYTGMSIVAWFNTQTGAPALRMAKSRSGTQGSYGIVSSGDTLANIVFGGDDGAKFVAGARITAQVDGTTSLDDMPGRLLFYTTPASSTTPVERMRIDSAGQVGIGASSSTSITLRVAKNITGAINGFGVASQGVIQSDVTTAAYGFYSNVGTQATAFTLSNLVHYGVAQGTIGVDSTVTSQTGFLVLATMTGAGENIGFKGNLAAATGRWNLYMQGTADNYLAGRLGVGATLTSGAMTQFTNTTAADKVLVVKGATSQTGYLTDWQNTSGTSLAYVDSSGNAKFVSIDGGSA